MALATNPASAAAAVVALRAELEMASRALESIDRKAALVPATLGVVAGIFIGSEASFTRLESIVLAGALATGIASVTIALRVLWTRVLTIGPNAATAAAATHLSPGDFDNAIAGSLAIAIDLMSEAAKWKGDRLNRAFGFAGATIMLLALARILGGIS